MSKPIRKRQQLEQPKRKAERKKTNAYHQRQVNTYFWRTYDQKEIDLVEEGSGKLEGYEFKWQPKEIAASTQKLFINTYPEVSTQVVHQEIVGNFFAAS